jgi:hypothetical protein
MRASKLITISTLAVLMGGTSFAIGQAGSPSLQSGSSAQGAGTMSQGSAYGSETKGSTQRAAESPVRRGEISGERGAKVQGSRESERGRAMAAERGRAITGQRGLAIAAERGRATTEQGPKPTQQMQRKSVAHARPYGQAETAQVYARASARETGAASTAQQRERLREIVAARRDIPRVSNLPNVRVNAVVPRNVQLAAIPEEVVRMYPRFRRHQAFIYRNEIVVVDPMTSRIVAVLPA